MLPSWALGVFADQGSHLGHILWRVSREKSLCQMKSGGLDTDWFNFDWHRVKRICDITANLGRAKIRDERHEEICIDMLVYLFLLLWSFFSSSYFTIFCPSNHRLRVCGNIVCLFLCAIHFLIFFNLLHNHFSLRRKQASMSGSRVQNIKGDNVLIVKVSACL